MTHRLLPDSWKYWWKLIWRLPLDSIAKHIQFSILKFGTLVRGCHNYVYTASKKFLADLIWLAVARADCQTTEFNPHQIFQLYIFIHSTNCQSFLQYWSQVLVLAADPSHTCHQSSFRRFPCHWSRQWEAWAPLSSWSSPWTTPQSPSWICKHAKSITYYIKFMLSI